MCIDLVLADPHPVVLEGLAQVFNASPEFSVKACVSNGNDALAAVQKFRPDILVLDLGLPIARIHRPLMSGCAIKLLMN